MSADRTSSLAPPGPAAWRARRFGGALADLDVAFAGDRPAVVTSLLAGCVCDADGHGVDTGEAWDWTLNQRLQALVAVRLASGERMLDVQAACARCGEAMELSLDLGLIAAAPAPPRFSWRADDGREFGLRLPSGRDLQRWLDAGGASPATMLAALVESVAGEPTSAGDGPPAAWLDALDDAFEAHDPLTAFNLQTSCPACAHESTIACDLEALLLAGFARTQARLLDEVLQLASALHWAEAEILALPGWRRAHYLQRLEAGVGR